MRKNYLFTCLLAFAGLAAAPSAEAQTTGTTNLTVLATDVDASVNAGNAKIAADGRRYPKTAYWSNYTGKDSYGRTDYLELDWDYNQTISHIKVYFVQGGDSIAYPTEAYIAYWNGRQWVKSISLPAADDKGVSEADASITTHKLRLYVSSNAACGILEAVVRGVRGDECAAATLSATSTTMPYIEGNDIVLSPTLTLPDGEEEEGFWRWTLPDGSQTEGQELSISGAGSYTVTYERLCGKESTLAFNVYIPGNDYEWQAYADIMNGDYRKLYPNGFPAPTKILPENVGQVGHKQSGWWNFAWGRKRNHFVTDVAIDNLLKRFNEDFAFFRDSLGWPPDKRAKEGYYSTVYLYGSGITGMSDDSTALGGWQGSTTWNGESWPCVMISYYPVACYDPAFTYDPYTNDAGNVIGTVTDQEGQMGACVHEGIHCMLADYDGCKSSVWFHESSDNWIMSEAAQMKERRNNPNYKPTSMGWLSAGSVIAPFMPIDCYSGLLQDGTFGGPSAEGVNMYGNNGQLCTWYRLIGGVQYSEFFPNALSQIMSDAAIPWIWQNCRDYILGSMGKALGDSTMRHFLVEYNSRRALFDLGKWDVACKNLVNNNWLAVLGPEGNTAGGNWKPNAQKWTATPFAKMTRIESDDNIRWYQPDAFTLPGWSAANEVPVHVTGKIGDIVSVHFKPLGKNMVCQLAYRTREGKCHYSEPVYGEGEVAMQLKEVPANNVVLAVVCNTDYNYGGESTRKARYDYRLGMGKNAYCPASEQVKWYDYQNTYKDPTFDEKQYTTGISEVEAESTEAKFGIKADKYIVKAGNDLYLSFTNADANVIPVQLYSLSGQLLLNQSMVRDGNITIPSFATPGVYVLRASTKKEKASVKIIVK